MAVEIISTSKFFDQLGNGVDFSQNTGNYCLNLACSVGERIRHELTMNVRWSFFGNSSNNVVVSGSGTIYTMTYGTWKDEGFAVGDKVVVDDDGATIGYGTVTGVNDAVMTLTKDSGVFPIDNPYTSIQFYGQPEIGGLAQLSALIFKFGLNDNDENFNYTSKVSNEDMAYYLAGITGTNQTMLPIGNYKSWVTESNIQIKDNGIVDTYWEQFILTHDFIVTPYYLEEWKANYEANTTPALLEGLASLKYAFECEFRTQLSYPASAKTKVVSDNLGSVAYDGENFNGFNNNYVVDSITYKDEAMASADGLITNETTTVEITISKLVGTFNADEPFILYHSYLPNSNEYIGTLATLQQNFLYDNAVNYAEGVSTAGANGIIKSCSGTIVATKLIITATIEYTAAQQLKLQSEAKYKLSVLIGDKTMVAGNSDKVMLRADYNDYVASADITDLFYIASDYVTNSYQILRHGQTILKNGVTSLDNGWNTDGYVFRYPFILNVTKKAFINSLNFMIVAYNDTTNEYFELDNYSFNLSDIVVKNDIQEINIDTTRGYLLRTADLFNKVFVEKGYLFNSVPPGTLYQLYDLYIGQKIKWQDWIKNNGVDSVFYNHSKTNDNLNYKTSNYSNLSSYKIKAVLLANVYGEDATLGTSGNTDYIILSPEMIIRDYDLPTTWVATVETFDVSGTLNLGGLIRTDADTLFRVTWVKGSAIRDDADFWATHNIQKVNSNGDDIYELSSRVLGYENNILKAVAGETYLKMTINYSTKTVVTECLIDYTKLEKGVSYNLFARLDDGIGSILDYKITEEGETKVTEDDEVKIIE